MPPAREVGFDAGFEGGETEFGEAGDLCLEQAASVDIAVRVAAPQPESVRKKR